MQKIRIVLADDHTLIREGFKALLGNNELFEIVGEAENGLELVEQIDSRQPDVVLVDIAMPRLTGLEVLEKAAEQFPAVKFIVLTMHEEPEYVLRAIQSGARGYLLKNIERSELERAIRTVADGGRYFSPAITTLLAESFTKPKEEIFELTPREKEVLEWVAEGNSTKQIADRLGISVRTVESHRINMLKKMGVSNTAELIKKSIHLKLISAGKD